MKSFFFFAMFANLALAAINIGIFHHYEVNVIVGVGNLLAGLLAGAMWATYPE